MVAQFHCEDVMILRKRDSHEPVTKEKYEVRHSDLASAYGMYTNGRRRCLGESIEHQKRLALELRNGKTALRSKAQEVLPIGAIQRARLEWRVDRATPSGPS